MEAWQWGGTATLDRNEKQCAKPGTATLETTTSFLIWSKLSAGRGEMFQFCCVVYSHFLFFFSSRSFVSLHELLQGGVGG